MVTDRSIQEAIARCVSAMTGYQNSELSGASSDLMAAEIQMVVAWAEEMGLTEMGIDRLILRPVEAELIARFGDEEGPRLLDEFLDVFDNIKALKDRLSS